MTIQSRIQQEKETARKKYGAFNSTHEAYGVLKEEVEEFWDSVKHKSYSEPGRLRKNNRCNLVSKFNACFVLCSHVRYLLIKLEIHILQLITFMVT